MKHTAWTSNNDSLALDMINGALCKKPGWKKLEEVSHFKYLNELILTTGVKTICDLGCGAGELGRVYKDYQYEGYDLPHIIEKVSKVVNPLLRYHAFDANNYAYNLLQPYELLVCNSFVSELTNPLGILRQILNNTSKFLILHRQKIGAKTGLEKYVTYANLTTHCSILGVADLNCVLKETGTQVVKELAFDGLVSLLIVKNVQTVSADG
jgi:hypothetical protein